MAKARKTAKRMPATGTRRRAAAGAARRKAGPRRKAAPAKRATRAAGPAVPMPALLVKASTVADLVQVPARTALAIDGAGGPEQEAFSRSVGALYGIAYPLKFARKAAGRDFKLGPLEGRWWAEGAEARAFVAPRESWRWRLRIAVPGDVSETEVAAAILSATSKKGGRLEGSLDAARVTLERIPAQAMGRVLHVGPYAGEPASFEKIHAAMAAAGRTAGLPHVEVYLSDPHRTAPERLKTVLLLGAEG